MARKFNCLALLIVSVFLLTSCDRVHISGSRRDNGNQVQVTKLYIYSFLSMNPLGMKRLNRDLLAFNDQLANSLRAHQFDVTSESAQDTALRNHLPINVIEEHRYAGGPIVSTALSSKVVPENEIIAANKSTEDRLMISHRLILFPAMTSFSGESANANGDVSWRLQAVKDDKVIAEGSIHYIADVRGFPGREMADELAAKLALLNIHG